MSSLEDQIGIENPFRFIDAFVEHISLESVGFTVQSKVGVVRVLVLKSFLKSICTFSGIDCKGKGRLKSHHNLLQKKRMINPLAILQIIFR